MEVLEELANEVIHLLVGQGLQILEKWKIS